MLERYIKEATALQRYRSGPLGGFTDVLAVRFHERGYSPGSIGNLLRGIDHLNRYLVQRGIGHVGEMRPEHIASFLKDHLPNCECGHPNKGIFRGAPAAVRHTIEYLCEQNLLRGFETAEPSPDSVDGVLKRLDAYLGKVRGLSKSTRVHHRIVAKRFLDSRHNRFGALKLAEMTSAEVLDYSREALTAPWSLATKKGVLGHLRVFLRFLWWERILNRDLSRAVPSVIQWRLADVPKHLPFKKVRLLLNTPDTDTPMGKRDRAIMMLLALLGLRAGEVAALKLDHVYWREGRLTVPRAKASRQRSLPLPSEAARALADYLQHGRPKTQTRALFLRCRAPIMPLSPNAVTHLVRHNTRRAGITGTLHTGSHVLRHSLATLLINKGVPVKQISDILGHADIRSTCIYTKVDVRRLSEVARPFPALKEN